MRKKIIFSVLILLFAFIIHNQYTVLAMNTGFETEDIDSDTQAHIFMKMEIELLESDPEGYLISNYDINRLNGDIALSFDNQFGITKKIGIYDASGIYKYGYSLLDYGSVCVEWDGVNIIIISVRGDRAVLVDMDANLIDMKRIKNNTRNNTYWHDNVFSNNKVIGQDTYVLKHSKLIKTDSSGKETILYDESMKKTLSNLANILYFVILFTIAIVWIIRYCMKNLRSPRSQYCL